MSPGPLALTYSSQLFWLGWFRAYLVKKKLKTFLGLLVNEQAPERLEMENHGGHTQGKTQQSL